MKLENKLAWANIFWLTGTILIIAEACVFLSLGYYVLTTGLVISTILIVCSISITSNSNKKIRISTPEIKLGKIYHLLYFNKKNHVIDAILEYTNNDGDSTIEIFRDVKFAVDPSRCDLNTSFASCMVDRMPKLNKLDK
ncbi:MAG: hypothetical protein WCK37_03950 [Candidatus Falkowbacteria bacterium]